MKDHSDDCLIGQTGHCTCTQALGQPVAQITRKRLVEEYQQGLTAGVEIGKRDGFVDGKHAGYDAGYLEGRAAAIAEMTSAMNDRQPTAAAPVDAEMPDYIKTASPITQAAWRAIHQVPPSELEAMKAVPSIDEPQGAWNQIIHGPEGGKTAEDITQALGIVNQPPVPTRHPHNIGFAAMLYVVTLALGAGLIAWTGMWFLHIGYPFLWGIGVAVVTFCSIIIKMDIDARKRL